MPDTFYPRIIHDIDIYVDGIVRIAAQTGLYCLDSENWARYTTDNGLPGTVVTSVVMYNNTGWALTDGGLACFSGGEWETIPEPEGFGLKLYYDMDISPDGTLWFATQQHGIISYDSITWAKYTTENGDIPDNYVNNVAAGEDGRIRFSILSDDENVNGLYCFSGDTYSSYRTTGPVHPSVLKVTVDVNDTVYFLSDSGISYFDGDQIVPYYKGSDFEDIWYYELDGVVDNNGNTWYVGPHGLTCYAGGQWIDYSDEEYLKDKKTLSIITDFNNIVWVGTDSGAVSFDGESWTVHNATTGFTDGLVECFAH